MRKNRPLDNPAFRRWFGDSVVVGEDGDPLVVYHGTPDVRGIFEGGFRKSPTRGGVYFATDDVRTAETYTDPHRAWDYQNAEPGVIPLYLSLKNPLVIDAKFKHWRETEQTIRKAMDAGNDGVVILNSIDHYATTREGKPRRDDASTVFAWFSPTQAKSALDGPMRARDINRWHLNDPSGRTLDVAGPNDGSFDPENPDVRKNPPRLEPHPGSPLDNPAFRRWFGDSVVVDRSGLPAVVYHGGFDIESAKVPAFRASKRSGYGAGIYLTPLRDVAQSYAQENNGVVGEYYARVKNPLLVLWNGAAQALIDLGWTPQKAQAKIEREEEQYGGVAGVIQSAAREKGYDGLFVLTKDASANLPEELEVARDVREIVLFDGWQAKSANKNLGTYERWGTDVTRNPERTFIPPQKVADEAAYGLYLRSQMPPSNRCCTPVGLARAKQLKNRQPVSVETLKRMRSYFQRHAVDKKGARWAIDSKGFQAWLLWGGDSGQDWCNRTLDQLRE